jgi:hypothetical protein
MVIQSDRLGPKDRAVLDVGRRGLGQAGWRSVLALDDLEVFVGPGRTPRVRQIHRFCILIGEYRPHGQALSALVGGIPCWVNPSWSMSSACRRICCWPAFGIAD